MPELPEVETIRRILTNDIVGKTISEIFIYEKKQFIGDQNQIIKGKVTKIFRKGKVLAIKVKKEKKTFYINIHLKMSGQLLYAQNKNKAVYKQIIPKTNSNTLPASTTRVIIVFSDQSALFFNDLRKFGWIKISDKLLLPAAVDVLSSEFTFQKFKQIITNVRKPIKLFLMDQEKIAGIGNIYANDALFFAKIDPRRKTDSLNNKEIDSLYKAIIKVIKEGLFFRGSSAKDESYILPDGSRGSYQNHFRVYDREGQNCQICNTKIVRIKQNGRSTFFCPQCQK